MELGAIPKRKVQAEELVVEVEDVQTSDNGVSTVVKTDGTVVTIGTGGHKVKLICGTLLLLLLAIGTAIGFGITYYGINSGEKDTNETPIQIVVGKSLERRSAFPSCEAAAKSCVTHFSDRTSYPNIAAGKVHWLF